MTGKEYAKKLNHMGLASQLKNSMRDFWINWDNESPEWKEEFLKNVKPDILIVLIDTRI